MKNKEINIGIMTRYYKSLNYGGNLQAYALVKFLNDNYNAEQICYSLITTEQNRSDITIILKQTIKKILYFVTCYKNYKNYLVIEKNRERTFESFNMRVIKNNGIVIKNESLTAIEKKYDYFIVGSDQVWNPKMFMPGFYLEFVKNNDKKIAYAASVASDNLECKYKDRIINDIESFKYISVRENSAKTLLSNYINKKIDVVVDPTLLLDKKDWNLIKSKEHIYMDYILCYFLGNNTKERELALEFARKKGLKVICILIANNGKRYFDINYGDIRLTPSPEEFITLIEDANYVFTDSFHACIFSYIYQKQFFVFNRDHKKSMNSRIYDLLDLFYMKERFCDDNSKLRIDYLLNLKDHIYEKNEKLEKEIKKSKDFLINSLNG